MAARRPMAPYSQSGARFTGSSNREVGSGKTGLSVNDDLIEDEAHQVDVDSTGGGGPRASGGLGV